jgi:chromosome segregation ATPase
MSNYNCPTLLCLLDLVYLLLSGDEGICQSIINTMSADTLESLVQIMSPKEVRVDLSMTGVDESLTQDDVIESDDSTPTVQNLSRLENSVVMVEEKREPHGMDQTARIAAATVLAVLGRHSFSGHDSEKAGRFSLLQGRMFDAANSFVSELNLTFSAGGGTALSTDMTKRRLRLLAALGTADNEEYLSGLLHTAETRRRRELTELSHHVHRCNEALEQYREKEKRLVSEKEAYSCRLAALSVSAQRDKSELQRSMAQNAKNLVATHLAERTKAEKRLQELSKQTAESERQLADAIRTAQSCRESEALAKSSLQQANARLNEVSSREQELAERTKHSESELGRVSDELRSLKASLNDILGKEKKMRGKMKEKEELLADMEESEIRMRESLENLFADMVSLARLYEIKEQEEAEARLKNDELVGKLKRQLEKERQRNAELEETQSRLQHDNEVLSNRYAKTREKLQREREKHQKEQEVQRRRNMGPVSYINQLHNQSMNAGSEKSRSEEANLRRRRKKPLVGGIENSQSSSASSPRRSRSRQRSRHHGM